MVKILKPKQSSTDRHLLVKSFAQYEVDYWNDQKIIDNLTSECGLTIDEARTIARAVYDDIKDKKEIDIKTLKMFINYHLFKHGFNGRTLSNQITLGISSYDLDNFIKNKSCENSNIHANNPETVSFTIAEITLKQYALKKVFSKDVVMAHLEGRIHLHDLGCITRVYCSAHSLRAIAMFGLGKYISFPTSSKPAKYAETLIGHLNTFLCTMSGYYAGALGVDFVNVYIAPYLVGRSYKEIKQIAQYLIFSLSQTSYARGGQAIFTDLNFFDHVPDHLRDIPAVGPGGKILDKTYKDFEPESRAFLRAVLEVLEEGDANGMPFQFPKCLDKKTPLYAKIDNTIKFITAGDVLELFKNHTIYLPSINSNRQTEWVKVSNVAYRGKETGIRIKLIDGKFIETTKDHQHYVWENENIITKEAHKLKTTDSLVYHPPIVSRGTSFLPLKIIDIKEVPIEAIAIEVDNPSHDFITGNGIYTKNCLFHITEKSLNDDLFSYACHVASKNGSVYFVFDRGETSLSACCRLRAKIDDDYYKEPERLRFCGFQNVTINLPQCAYRGDVFKELDKSLELVIKAHKQKRRFIEQISKPGCPMYEVCGKPYFDGEPYINLDRASYLVGIMGLNECVQFLTGKQLHEDENSYKLGLKIISHLYIKAKQLQKETGLKLVIEETPGEGSSRRLALLDYQNFPQARGIIKGTAENPYYTNSIHLAVDAPVSLIERIKLQSKFHPLIEAGAIIHAFVGEKLPPASSIRNLLIKTFKNTQCEQLVISPEFSVCKNCQKTFLGLTDRCPICNNITEQYTRIVGYYSKIENWNDSKKQELKDRHRGNYII